MSHDVGWKSEMYSHEMDMSNEKRLAGESLTPEQDQGKPCGSKNWE